MADNYKHLYEQMKKMLEKYQDEIVPGFRKQIEDMEKSMVEVVRCKDCKHWNNTYCGLGTGDCHVFERLTFENHFCAYGERE